MKLDPTQPGWSELLRPADVVITRDNDGVFIEVWNIAGLVGSTHRDDNDWPELGSSEIGALFLDDYSIERRSSWRSDGYDTRCGVYLSESFLNAAASGGTL